MKSLTAYVIDGHDVRIRPAPVERDWMDSTDERFAYRWFVHDDGPSQVAFAIGEDDMFRPDAGDEAATACCLCHVRREPQDRSAVRPESVALDAAIEEVHWQRS